MLPIVIVSAVTPGASDGALHGSGPPAAAAAGSAEPSPPAALAPLAVAAPLPAAPCVPVAAPPGPAARVEPVPSVPPPALRLTTSARWASDHRAPHAVVKAKRLQRRTMDVTRRERVIRVSRRTTNPPAGFRVLRRRHLSHSENTVLRAGWRLLLRRVTPPPNAKHSLSKRASSSA